MPDPKDFTATIDELAKEFSISTSTARAWLRKGHIPRSTYLKAGTTYRFNLKMITAVLLGEGETEESPFEPLDAKLLDVDGDV